MKKRLLTLLLGLSLTGCFQDSDINIDPNRSAAADPALLFTGAATQLSLLRAGELTWPVALSTQMWASGARWGLQQAQYDQARIRSAWGRTYTDVLKNLQVAIDLGENATPKPQNTIAQCQILMAMTYAQTTLLWGDIPFSEAATGTVDFPKFDTQADVLNGVLALLDDAISRIDASSRAIRAPSDPFYGGDMTKWKKFAQSLKLRTLLTMVDADPGKAAAIAQLLALPAGSMIAGAADNARFPFFNAPGRQNPRFSFTAIFRGGVQSDWYASKPVYDLLVSLNDPRIPYFFQPGPGAAAGQYVAINSVETYTATTSLVNMNLLRAELPEVLFSHSEQLLLEAEAMGRGFAPGGLAAAEARYREGARQSLLSFGVPEAPTTAYVASLPALTPENYRLHLNQQQYLDLFMRPVEGWVQQRRSGPDGSEIPSMTPPTGAPVNRLIRRLLYRSEEINANPNTPAGLQLDTKMWFDQ